jgi:hypothetical protein
MVTTLNATTAKAKTRDMLASAAGLATKSKATEEKTFDPTTETFKVVVSSAIGPYTEGQVLEAPYQWSNLQEQKHITTYYDLALTDTIGEHELKPKQIWVAIQAVGIDDALDNPGEIDTRRIEYLQTVQSSTQAMSQADFTKLLTTNEVARDAARLGSEMPEELQEIIEIGIDGKKTWDGTPIKVEEQLVKTCGDNVLAMMPLVGSRKTGKTTLKDGVAVSTDTVPADYTGLTDFFIGQLPGEEKPRVIRWFDVFVRGMAHVKQRMNKIELLSAMANAPTTVDGKLIPEEYKELWNNGSPDKPAVLGVRADMTGDITNFVNRVAQAVAFYQAKRAISTELSKSVSYELVGGSVEASFKRRKPIQMLTLREQDGRIRETASDAPISLSTFIRYGRHAAECKAKGGTLAKLIELSTVKKNPKAKPVAGPTAENTSYKIEKAAQLEDIFSNAKDYIGNHLNLVQERLADKRNGGRFCYQLVTLRDELDAIIAEDKAGNSPVLVRANAWHKEQLQATANMDKDEMERKKNLKIATN